LHNFQRIVADFDAGAGLRDVLQMFDDQPVERFRTVERKLEPQFAVECPQQRAAFDQVAAALLFEKTAGEEG